MIIFMAENLKIQNIRKIAMRSDMKSNDILIFKYQVKYKKVDISRRSSPYSDMSRFKKPFRQIKS